MTSDSALEIGLNNANVRSTSNIVETKEGEFMLRNLKVPECLQGNNKHPKNKYL
ncbi:22327_t:CDS:2 [Dentiscutata erythropus]|uniref:22327_t:CDS:1 n=1 Tax=Dentiscutata erythropus TaxID=1348616 RepID=A0A9N9H4U8_9GLOM|nr:22327_t:CDS:2 [Dentiscutata erythropus]